MKVESQDLWGRMWGPKPPQKSNKLIINNKYGCYGGDEVSCVDTPSASIQLTL